MANEITITLPDLPEHTVDYLETLRQLLLTDPETGQGLVIEGLPEEHKGAFAFRVRNPQTGARWRHHIRTEEV